MTRLRGTCKTHSHSDGSAEYGVEANEHEVRLESLWNAVRYGKFIWIDKLSLAFMLWGVFVDGGAEDLEITSATSLLFLIVVVNVDLHGAILSFGDNLVRHERLLHDFDIDWVPRMQGVALIVDTWYQLGELVIQDFYLSLRLLEFFAAINIGFFIKLVKSFAPIINLVWYLLLFVILDLVVHIKHSGGKSVLNRAFLCNGHPLLVLSLQKRGVGGTEVNGLPWNDHTLREPVVTWFYLRFWQGIQKLTLRYRGLLMNQWHGQGILLLIVPWIFHEVLVLLLFDKHPLKWGELFLRYPRRPGQGKTSLSSCGLCHVALLFKSVIVKRWLIHAVLRVASESFLCLTGPIPEKSDNVTAYFLELCIVVNFDIFC